MPISVGTIVTRHDPYTKDFPCESEEMPCVGHIETIESEDLYPDNPAVVVQWWTSCSYHANKLNVDMRYTLDQMWEIGQIPI